MSDAWRTFHRRFLRSILPVVLPACVTLLRAPPLFAQAPGADLQVYLMTMGPGASIEERFGHNAIWIRDTVRHTDIVYNYGTFDMGRGLLAPIAFAARFAMGPQQYWLGHTDLETTLYIYRRAGRNLSAQELDLAPAQRADLASRLATNALEENRYYAYDYFRDNCSTRVRDMLDLELGGALRRATIGKPAEGTLRFHTLRSITNNKFLFITIDAAFSGRVDRPLDQWDEMFLPAKVQERIRDIQVAGSAGQQVPLVKSEFPMLTIDAYHVDVAPPRWGGVLTVISLVVAALIRLAQSRRRVAVVGRIVAGTWLLITGTGGAVLIFFWAFTAHVATWANWHLLLLSPVALLLVRGFWRVPHAGSGRWTPRLAIFLMFSVLIGGVAAVLPGVTGQDMKIVAQLTALPTFVAALEALRGWNRRQAAVVDGGGPVQG